MAIRLHPISTYTKLAAPSLAKRARKAVSSGLIKARNWMLDVRPGDPPCFVAGMGLGGEVDNKEAELQSMRLSIFSAIIKGIMLITLDADGKGETSRAIREAFSIIKESSASFAQATSIIDALNIIERIKTPCNKILNDMSRSIRKVLEETGGYYFEVKSAEDRDQGYPLLDEAKALARAGRLGEGIEVAEKIDALRLRACALSEICEDLLSEGSVDDAIMVAQRINIPGARSQLLLECAMLLVKAGEADEAHFLILEASMSALMAKDPIDRLEALIRIAEALIKIDPELTGLKLQG